jgi:hypothetical protein
MARKPLSAVRIALALALVGANASIVLGQTREKGPWWPHPILGPEDEVGASNWITPDEVHLFAFIFTPVRFKGAAGSPGRPIAIR